MPECPHCQCPATKCVAETIATCLRRCYDCGGYFYTLKVAPATVKGAGGNRD